MARVVAAFVLLILFMAGAACPEDSLTSTSALASPHPLEPGEPRIGRSLEPWLGSGETVPVIILLADDPLGEISEEEFGRIEPEMRARREEARAIHRRYSTGSRASMAEDAARLAALEASRYSKADLARLRETVAGMKALKDRARARIAQRMRQAVEAGQTEVESFVHGLGGSVTYRFFVQNAIAARLPGRAISAVAAHPLVRRVVEDGLREACLDVSVPTIGAPTFWSAGETGGVWYNATLDTGVDTGHPNMGKPGGWWQVVKHDTARWNDFYRDDPNTPDDLFGHGTHVAGIMNSNHETFRGVAFGSWRSVNLKAGWRHYDARAAMYDSDAMAAVQWGISNATIDVLNLSFGSLATAGDDDYARFYDALVHAWGIVFTVSAGNDGTDGLSTPGIAYNGICVANVDDRGTTDRSDDVLASNSSRGPTPTPARKKPDLAAPGCRINAPNYNWEEGPDFVEKWGTSMAAPHVAGAATLLHDVGVDDPRAVKAVLINTTDSRSWWTPGMGWGEVNLDRAFVLRHHWYVDNVSPDGHLGSYRLYRVPVALPYDKATLVWNRRVNWNGASYPSTYYDPPDLDLHLYREANGVEAMPSTNPHDNVEQVYSTFTGPAIIRVEAATISFPGGASAATYAIAVPPGTVEANGPSLSIAASLSTASPPLNAKFRLLLTISNNGDTNAPACKVQIWPDPDLWVVSGLLKTDIGSIPAGEQKTVEIWFKATAPGTKEIDFECDTWAFGREWLDQGTITVEPGPPDTAAPYTVMSLPSIGYRSGGNELISNGGFESNLSTWSTTGTVAAEFGSAASGLRCAKLGPGSAALYQNVYINASASRAFLSFSYRADAGLLKPAGCRICDSSGNAYITPFSVLGKVSGWQAVTFDISRFKGQTIQVRFYSSGSLLGNSTLWVDDVSVKEGETVWVSSDATPLAPIATDNAAGIDQTFYRFPPGGWLPYTEPFLLPQEGSNSLSYYSTDNSGNTEPVISTVVHKDTRPPVSVLSIGSPRVIAGGWERLLLNPGFENGLIGWDATGSATTTSATVHSGSAAGKVGGSAGSGTISRDVAVSANAGCAFLSAWVTAVGTGNTLGVYSAAVVDPETGMAVDYGIQGSTMTLLDWVQIVWDVSRFRGRTVRLLFGAGSLSGQVPTLFVDDVSLREDCILSILPSTQLQIRSFDRVGVESYQRSVDGGSYVDGDLFTIASQGTRNLTYRARDRIGHTEPDIATRVFVDTDGPLGYVQINSGAEYTTSRLVTLSLTASDVAGVPRMRIRNSDGAYGGWEAFSSSRQWTFSEGGGRKTVVVQYQDGLGNISPETSDSIEYVPPAHPRIGDVKLLGPHPVAVTLKDKRISGVFSSRKMFYIQESDRSSGIKVYYGSLAVSPSPGQSGTFEGVIQLDSNQEPQLYLTAFSLGSAGPVPAPVGLMNRELGGGPWGNYIPGITGGRGLHNIGLLVRTWGKVVSWSISPPRIWINDGSAPSGGVMVDMTQGGSIPVTGSMVQVTGNLGCVLSGSEVKPVLRPRSPEDVVVF